MIHLVYTPRFKEKTDSKFIYYYYCYWLVKSFLHFSWKHIFAKAIVRPFALFAREPIIQLLGIYMAFVYVSVIYE